MRAPRMPPSLMVKTDIAVSSVSVTSLLVNSSVEIRSRKVVRLADRNQHRRARSRAIGAVLEAQTGIRHRWSSVRRRYRCRRCHQAGVLTSPSYRKSCFPAFWLKSPAAGVHRRSGSPTPETSMERRIQSARWRDWQTARKGVGRTGVAGHGQAGESPAPSFMSWLPLRLIALVVSLKVKSRITTERPTVVVLDVGVGCRPVCRHRLEPPRSDRAWSATRRARSWCRECRGTPHSSPGTMLHHRVSSPRCAGRSRSCSSSRPLALRCRTDEHHRQQEP